MKITAVPNKDRTGFHIPSEFNKALLSDWLKRYRRFEIVPIVPESRHQRGFYHSAICALYAFFHERLDHRNWQDIQAVHEWLKVEYNGEYLVINEKAHRVAISTKGKLSDGYLHRCIEGLIENYGLDPRVLETSRYKHWRDAVYPFGGPDNYIDYLVDIKLLTKPAAV
jgi:hypothetical protein